MNYAEMSKDELINVQVEKEKELRIADNSLQIIEDELLSQEKEKVKLQNDLSNLRQKMIDNEKIRNKARFNVKSIKSEIKELNFLYWKKG